MSNEHERPSTPTTNCPIDLYTLVARHHLYCKLDGRRVVGVGWCAVHDGGCCGSDTSISVDDPAVWKCGNCGKCGTAVEVLRGIFRNWEPHKARAELRTEIVGLAPLLSIVATEILIDQIIPRPSTPEPLPPPQPTRPVLKLVPNPELEARKRTEKARAEELERRVKAARGVRLHLAIDAANERRGDDAVTVGRPLYVSLMPVELLDSVERALLDSNDVASKGRPSRAYLGLRFAAKLLAYQWRSLLGVIVKKKTLTEAVLGNRADAKQFATHAYTWLAANGIKQDGRIEAVDHDRDAWRLNWPTIEDVAKLRVVPVPADAALDKRLEDRDVWVLYTLYRNAEQQLLASFERRARAGDTVPRDADLRNIGKNSDQLRLLVGAPSATMLSDVRRYFEPMFDHRVLNETLKRLQTGKWISIHDDRLWLLARKQA